VPASPELLMVRQSGAPVVRPFGTVAESFSVLADSLMPNYTPMMGLGPLSLESCYLLRDQVTEKGTVIGSKHTLKPELGPAGIPKADSTPMLVRRSFRRASASTRDPTLETDSGRGLITSFARYTSTSVWSRRRAITQMARI